MNERDSIEELILEEKEEENVRKVPDKKIVTLAPIYNLETEHIKYLKISLGNRGSEKQRIAEVYRYQLAYHQNKKSELAKTLGIDRRTLEDELTKYGV